MILEDRNVKEADRLFGEYPWEVGTFDGDGGRRDFNSSLEGNAFRYQVGLLLVDCVLKRDQTAIKQIEGVGAT